VIIAPNGLGYDFVATKTATQPWLQVGGKGAVAKSAVSLFICVF